METQLASSDPAAERLRREREFAEMERRTEIFFRLLDHRAAQRRHRERMLREARECEIVI